MSKPTTRGGYSPDQAELVRQTCLYVATKLGDLLDDLVIVGGLVPSLLIDQKNLPEGGEAHVGTLDLDVGLAVALLDDQRYEELTERLREAGFAPDKTTDGKLIRQRWQILDGRVTLDFLIAPSREGDRGGRLRHIESDFAAFIMPGLQLAFRDRRQVTLTGQTIMAESATRTLWVCEAGAFIVLKALAVQGRGINKDPYDLFYLLQNYEEGVAGVAKRLRPLLDDPDTQRALQVLRDDFDKHDGVGPVRAAKFLMGEPNDAIQADVVSYVQELLAHL